MGARYAQPARRSRAVTGVGGAHMSTEAGQRRWRGRGPGSGCLPRSRGSGRLAMRLTTPPAIRRLRRSCTSKAKAEPTYRFYRLYDKIYRADILAHAYALAKGKRRGAGCGWARRSSRSSRGADGLAGSTSGRPAHAPVSVRRGSAGVQVQNDGHPATSSCGPLTRPGSNPCEPDASLSTTAPIYMTAARYLGEGNVREGGTNGGALTRI